MAAFIDAFDPSQQASGRFDVSLQNGGWLIVHNESPVELIMSSGSTLPPFLLAAYTIRAKLVPLNVNYINWQQAGNVSGGGQAPISLVFGEAYAPDEWTGGEIYLPLVRLTNVGNQSTGGSVSDIINDGNAPATVIVEATPSDQASSSVKDFNDATGFRKVLSAGVLRFIWNIIRGDAVSAKASIVFGDSGDATITTLYGSVQGGQPANLGTITGTGATFASAITAAGLVVDGRGGFGGSSPAITFLSPATEYWTPQTGAAQGHVWITWNGTTFAIPFSVGGQFEGATSWVDNSGHFQDGGHQVMPGRSAGGGASGAALWEGTTDPAGSASEGDIWLDA